MVYGLRFSLVVGAVFLMAAPACADTVYLQNGTQVDGKVSQPNANSVAVQVGNNRMVFQKSEVDRIEENDKKGSGSAVVRSPMADKHEEEMKAQTGLTAEQRQEVLDLMEPLRSDDPLVRTETRKRLIAKSKEMNIVKFLQYSMSSLSPLFASEVMEVLWVLDKTKGREVLREQILNTVPDNRAKALELLSQDKDAKPIEVIARGVIDHVPQVQIAAAQGLATLGEKRITPVLISGLKSNDIEVRNACRSALAKIWDEKGKLQSAEEWQRFWNENIAGVKNPIRPESLTPLVSPDAPVAFRNE